MYNIGFSFVNSCNTGSLVIVFPRVYGKGHAAAQVFDLMVRMRRESCGRDPEVRSQIDSLVIIDRAVDLISPLPTQLTYEVRMTITWV